MNLHIVLCNERPEIFEIIDNVDGLVVDNDGTRWSTVVRLAGLLSLIFSVFWTLISRPSSPASVYFGLFCQSLVAARLVSNCRAISSANLRHNLSQGCREM